MRTVEVYFCDVCEAEGVRHQHVFPDGRVLAMDRCERHGENLAALADEKGEWLEPKRARAGFRKSTAQDLRRAVAQAT